eukprot:g5386.t1
MELHISGEVLGASDFPSSDIAGYGFCYVPSAPGEHSTDIVLWRPAGNGMEQLRAYFLGAHPKLQDPTVASHEGDRFELQTSTTGRVHVRFQVMLRGAADHGLTLS